MGGALLADASAVELWEGNDKQLCQDICHPAATKAFTPEMLPWSVI